MGQRHESEPLQRPSRLLEDFVARVRPTVPDLTAELDAAAADLFRAFDAGGVDAILLKGPALARLLYSDDEHRLYSDVDLLVAPEDVGSAREALSLLGYRNMSQPMGIEDVGGVVHQECWLGARTGGDQLLVELHLWLAGSRVAPADTWRTLASSSTAIELAGCTVPVLNREGLAMHLAAHAAQHGPWYVKGCTELELGLERWPIPIWRGAARIAAEIGATDVFAAGLRLVPTGREMATALDLPANDRADWEVRHNRVRPRGTFHLQALEQTAGLRARVSLMRRMVFPSRQWIEWQHPWARRGWGRRATAYGLHIVRLPFWAGRAWLFRRRADRAAGL